jgi:divalent metal cation (Fe/Co/Zn/Cd) transporter
MVLRIVSYLKRIDYIGFSFLKNLATGIGKLFIGLSSSSALIILNGIYNLILCFFKFISISTGKMIDKRVIKQTKINLKQYDFLLHFMMGVSVVIMGIILFVSSMHTYQSGEMLRYNSYSVYMLALGTFIKLGFSIYGTVTFRNNKEELIFSTKLTNFADALFSLVLTACAIFTMKNTENASFYSAAFGIFASNVIFVIGVWLIVHIFKNKEFGKQYTAFRKVISLVFT